MYFICRYSVAMMIYVRSMLWYMHGIYKACTESKEQMRFRLGQLKIQYRLRFCFCFQPMIVMLPPPPIPTLWCAVSNLVTGDKVVPKWRQSNAHFNWAIQSCPWIKAQSCFGFASLPFRNGLQAGKGMRRRGGWVWGRGNHWVNATLCAVPRFHLRPSLHSADNWVKLNCCKHGLGVAKVERPANWQLAGCQLTVLPPPPL